MLNADAIGIDGENNALEKPFEDATAAEASGELIGQFTVHHLGEARFEQEVSIRRCHRPQDIVGEVVRVRRRRVGAARRRTRS